MRHDRAVEKSLISFDSLPETRHSDSLGIAQYPDAAATRPSGLGREVAGGAHVVIGPDDLLFSSGDLRERRRERQLAGGAALAAPPAHDPEHSARLPHHRSAPEGRGPSRKAKRCEGRGGPCRDRTYDLGI